MTTLSLVRLGYTKMFYVSQILTAENFYDLHPQIHVEPYIIYNLSLQATSSSQCSYDKHELRFQLNIDSCSGFIVGFLCFHIERIVQLFTNTTVFIVHRPSSLNHANDPRLYAITLSRLNWICYHDHRSL